jgi:RHS repeat-associated protein
MRTAIHLHLHASAGVITRVEGGLTYTQTFDAENRLISVTVSGQTTQFVYDGDGNLVKKFKPDGSKTIYVGGIYEVDKASGGSVTRTITYYPTAGAMRINSTLYYVLKDHLGSASVVTDASGNILGEQRYYPFGETRLSTGTIFTDRLFTGQREMAGLGIYHYGARFYSPKLGRFLSADSIVPNPSNPQDLNRFSYVRNNPLRYIDPSGHVACRTKEECQEMGTTPGGGFCKPQPNPDSGGTSTRRDRRAGGEVDSDFAILPPLNPGGGPPSANPDPGSEGNNNEPGDIIYGTYSNRNRYNDIVDFLYDAATLSQNIATLIDIPFAITEVIFMTGECIAAPPGGCVTGALMGEAAFNLTGANALETGFSGASLALTFTADLMDDGKLGEATSTSFVTFLAGGLMFDPIGDVIIDGYASGYSNGIFNGIDTLMNGGPLVIPK